LALRQNDPMIFTGTGRILVMDDEEAVRNLVGRMLGRLGYQATTTRDGQEAVAVYGRLLASGESFSAVILDLTVFAGMGGKEAARQLLALDPRARIIVTSGYAEDPVMADWLRHGFKGVIPKPFEMAELSATLKKVIDGAESPD
jgi:two-component system, cell cycle sensor histidine kinase and response regulator CckA